MLDAFFAMRDIEEEDEGTQVEELYAIMQECVKLIAR